jgi:hypothetical protein
MTASEKRVKAAVDAIGKLNIREFREALAVVDARWLADDELDGIVPAPNIDFEWAARDRDLCEST